MYLKQLYLLLLVCLIISHSSKAQDYQLPAAQPSSHNHFLRSVFSSGIASYLKDTFNASSYVQDFLPNNFFHMTELLQHGNQTGKNKIYFRSVLRLFRNKLVEANYINSYAFCDLLSQFPSLMERHFVVNIDRALGSLKEIIYELQFQQFKNNFPLFKSNPETFLESLSQEIEDAAELRKLMMMFLEVSMSKLIWSPEDGIETWNCVKKIADNLAQMYHKSIISDQDDLNSLYITLLERYCMFLDIASTNMDIKTFENIRNDISTHHINLLELEEQEELLETKMQRFTRCLIQVEAKTRAYEQGMLI